MPLLNQLQAVVITVMTLLAPRMIINLRQEYHQHASAYTLGTIILPGGISFQSEELSWNAERPEDTDSITIDASVLDYWITLLGICMITRDLDLN